MLVPMTSASCCLRPVVQHGHPNARHGIAQPPPVHVRASAVQSVHERGDLNPLVGHPQLLYLDHGVVETVLAAAPVRATSSRERSQAPRALTARCATRLESMPPDIPITTADPPALDTWSRMNWVRLGSLSSGSRSNARRSGSAERAMTSGRLLIREYL